MKNKIIFLIMSVLLAVNVLAADTYISNTYINVSDLYVTNLSVSANSFFGGVLSPTTTLIHDIGSGASRWRNIYASNFSGDYMSVYGVTSTGNISADYFLGNLSWSNLTDYPVACPVNTYITQLNDSVTCTSIPVQNSTSWERSGTDVYLANSGDRVGIGTDDPSSSLHVKTNGGKVMFEHTGATSSGWITFENSVQGRRGYIQGDAGDGAMRIDASGTGKIQIGNAQLGIGTVPSTTFHIKDAGGEIRWNINYE